MRAPPLDADRVSLVGTRPRQPRRRSLRTVTHTDGDGDNECTLYS